MKVIKKIDTVWLFLEIIIIVLTFFQIFIDNPFDMGVYEFQIAQFHILEGALLFWGLNVIYTIVIKIFFKTLRKLNNINLLLNTAIILLRYLFYLGAIM